MRLPDGLRILAFAVALSAAAPTVLLAAGVADPDLLLVVFLPSVAVGLITAWGAHRWLPPREPWAYQSGRMP